MKLQSPNSLKFLLADYDLKLQDSALLEFMLKCIHFKTRRLDTIKIYNGVVVAIPFALTTLRSTQLARYGDN